MHWTGVMATPPPALAANSVLSPPDKIFFKCTGNSTIFNYILLQINNFVSNKGGIKKNLCMLKELTFKTIC